MRALESTFHGQWWVHLAGGLCSGSSLHGDQEAPTCWLKQLYHQAGPALMFREQHCPCSLPGAGDPAPFPMSCWTEHLQVIFTGPRAWGRGGGHSTAVLPALPLPYTSLTQPQALPSRLPAGVPPPTQAFPEGSCPCSLPHAQLAHSLSIHS